MSDDSDQNNPQSNQDVSESAAQEEVIDEEQRRKADARFLLKARHVYKVSQMSLDSLETFV